MGVGTAERSGSGRTGLFVQVSHCAMERSRTGVGAGRYGATVTAPTTDPPATAPARGSARRGRARPSASDLLAAAVGVVPGGTTRPGQQQMTTAIEESIHSGEHLLV